MGSIIRFGNKCFRNLYIIFFFRKIYTICNKNFELGYVETNIDKFFYNKCKDKQQEVNKCIIHDSLVPKENRKELRSHVNIKQLNGELIKITECLNNEPIKINRETHIFP